MQNELVGSGEIALEHALRDAVAERGPLTATGKERSSVRANQRMSGKRHGIRFLAWGVASVPYFPANIASALALTELPSALNPLYLSATLYALTNSSSDVPFFPAACASLRKSL